MNVTTDEGLEGWVEAFGFRAGLPAKLVIEELIGLVCIGRNATQIASSVAQRPGEAACLRAEGAFNV
jgi:hypothetical protein